MPKCLHPPCPNQVADALYCDEHKYIPHWTTNLSVAGPPQSSIGSSDWPSYERSGPQSVRNAPHRASMLWLPLLVLILAILVVGLIVILKLIF